MFVNITSPIITFIAVFMAPAIIYMLKEFQKPIDYIFILLGSGFLYKFIDIYKLIRIFQIPKFHYFSKTV